MSIPSDDAAPQPRRSPRRWLRAICWSCALLVFALLTAKAAYIGLGRNLYTVIPGQLYRCAQPTGADLEQMIQKNGVRTVVNLRGSCPLFPWYLDECRTAHQFNVSQEDVFFSAARLPSVNEVRRLVEVLERSEKPIVLHCKRGVDRTGLGSAIAILLLTDRGLPEARQQLSLRYGHLRLGRPAHLSRFFDFYEEWLSQEEKTHSPEAFREWAVDYYCPGECRCELEFLDFPLKIIPGKPFAVQIRAHNTSILPWHFSPGNDTGIHAYFHILDERMQSTGPWRAGRFDATVAVGESIDLTLALPSLKPGHYRLRVDMVDEQACSFFQAGSEWLEKEFEVVEQVTASDWMHSASELSSLAHRLVAGR